MTSPLAALTSAINDKRVKESSDEEALKPDRKVNWNDPEVINMIMGAGGVEKKLREYHLTAASFKHEYEADFSTLSTEVLEKRPLERGVSHPKATSAPSIEAKMASIIGDKFKMLEVKRFGMEVRDIAASTSVIVASTPRSDGEWIRREFKNYKARETSTPTLERSKFKLEE